MSTTKDLEAKIVILGSSNVGKTTLLSAYLDPTSISPSPVPTVGASFQTKRLISPPDAPDTTLRLQIWDTAGQERFRSISRLYYRGADAALLCYDLTDDRSFDEMGFWMAEVRANCGPETIVHVVGTKADIVAEDPARRQVPFERCIQYVAEHLQEQHGQVSNGNSNLTTPGLTPGVSAPPSRGGGRQFFATLPGSMGRSSPSKDKAISNRGSGFWGYSDASWDCCHEISARDGEGVDEVFRVITRKLIEQHNRRERARDALETPGFGPDDGAYFDGNHYGGGGGGGGGAYGGHGQAGMDARGSFRLTSADKRRSWLNAFGTSYPGTPGTPGAWGTYQQDEMQGTQYRGGRCC